MDRPALRPPRQRSHTLMHRSERRSERQRTSGQGQDPVDLSIRKAGNPICDLLVRAPTLVDQVLIVARRCRSLESLWRQPQHHVGTAPTCQSARSNQELDRFVGGPTDSGCLGPDASTSTRPPCHPTITRPLAGGPSHPAQETGALARSPGAKST
jgi:hypothetical protein